MEDAFSAIEGQAAEVLGRVIHGSSIVRYSPDHWFLLHFLALQLHRTRLATEKQSRFVSLIMTYLTQEVLERHGQISDDIRVIARPDVSLSLGVAEDYARSISDLDIKIVRSRCHARFITSDNPVVTYNEWCQGVKHTGITGGTCSGLQIFYPISPTCLMMLYDEGVYSVAGDNHGQLDVTSSKDIYQINRLQSVFAQENLYFSEWNDRGTILNGIPRVVKMRDENQEIMHIAHSESLDDQDEYSSDLLHGYTQMPNVNLKLRFCSLRRRAKNVNILDRASLLLQRNVG